MSKNDYQVELKEIDALLVASTQVVGKYSDCGIGFGKIGRRFGRYICGKPMMLCHDTEYREEDANFEVAMPIKRGAAVDDIQVKQLPGGPCISLMHLGPYDELGRSYERILRFAKEYGHDYVVPTREVYHKGPGMIFRGNPRKYLTEIQLMLSES